MLTMSWFPQLLCWFSMIHNIPVGTFYCRFSCEQFLMQLLEHLTETVHVANPHPTCEEFKFQVFPEGFVTWLLRNRTTEVPSRPPWKIFHHSSGRVTTRVKKEQEVASGRGRGQLEIINVLPSKQLKVARIYQMPPLKAFLQVGQFHHHASKMVFHQRCSNTNPSGSVHQTTGCPRIHWNVPDHRKDPQRTKNECKLDSGFDALLQKDHKSGSRWGQAANHNPNPSHKPNPSCNLGQGVKYHIILISVCLWRNCFQVFLVCPPHGAI